jgi:hypothetical protein
MPVVALSQWLRASDFIGRRKGVTGQSHLHRGALKKDLTRLKATRESQASASQALFRQGLTQVWPPQDAAAVPISGSYVIG